MPATLPTAPVVPVEAMRAVVPKFLALSGAVPAAVEPAGIETQDLAKTQASAARFGATGAENLEGGKADAVGPIPAEVNR